MRKSRNILAVVLVAMALCADRAVAVTPTVRPQISQVTRQVVDEWSRRFRHVVPVVRIVQDRQEGMQALPGRLEPIELPAGVHSTESTPFQFRLPPPSL